MSKFKVGDYVVFHPERVTEATPNTSWQFVVPTTPMEVLSTDDVKVYLKGSVFTFHEGWLEPAKFEFREKGLGIKNVIFSGPATIVFWTDGTKTVVKCRKGDKFDPEKGIAMACAKKLLGNEDGYHKEIAKYTKTAKNDELAALDTEKLRSFVTRTCNSFSECADCPCKFSNGGKCFIIATANREQLSIMYKQFLHAGKLWKEESNA